MKRSGFQPNQQHQAFTSLQPFSYNQSDKSSKPKHSHHNRDSSSNNYNYNYQPNKNNFRKKSSNNFNNQHKISIEKPQEKQAATTAFSIGIGQDQISSSLSTSSLNQTKIKIEKRKSPKLEFRSSSNQNLIISSIKTESEEVTSDSNQITTKSDSIQINDETNIDDDSINENNDQIVQVPIKDFYTPEEILSLKPISPPSKRIQASGFYKFLQLFSENSQDNSYKYGRNNKNYRKNRNNRNNNWKSGKSNSKKMVLREHSENRFVGLSMISRAGLNNEFSDEIKRSQAQLILNKLSKINITQSLNEIKSLRIPLNVIVDLLLDTATSDSDFPERNPQIGNMLDFTFRFCSINNEFKSILVSKSLSKSEEINNVKDPFAPIGSLQSIITWLAALFAGFTITDYQFVNFANQVIEKQPIERALEIIRTGLYVAGRSLDQRNKKLGEPLFDFLQNNRSKHGYTNFLISELFLLRNGGWSLNAISQSNGNIKKTINIVKRSNSQSLIQEKQDSNSSMMISSSSNLSKLAISDSTDIINKNYNDYNLLQSTDEIELMFLNYKTTSKNFDTDSNIQTIFNSSELMTKYKIDTIVHTCFFLFKKHIQSANDFACFTEKLIQIFLLNEKENNHDKSEIDNINDLSEKICSIILNEQSLFESIVREEESKQLWYPVFMLNAYLYSDNIIQFDFIVQSYSKIPDDCFKPSKISFINKIAEITGVAIDDVEKLYQTFHIKSNDSNKQVKCLLDSKEKTEKTNAWKIGTNVDEKCNNESDEMLVEALINLCNPLDIQFNPEVSEISAGVFIRDIFEEIFVNNEENEIDFEIIKISFEPYIETIYKLIEKFERISKSLILRNLQQCRMNEKQMKASIEFLHIE